MSWAKYAARVTPPYVTAQIRSAGPGKRPAMGWPIAGTGRPFSRSRPAHRSPPAGFGGRWERAWLEGMGRCGRVGMVILACVAPAPGDGVVPGQADGRWNSRVSPGPSGVSPMVQEIVGRRWYLNQRHNRTWVVVLCPGA